MISINITKKLDSIGKRRSRAFAINRICGKEKKHDLFENHVFGASKGKNGTIVCLCDIVEACVSLPARGF